MSVVPSIDEGSPQRRILVCPESSFPCLCLLMFGHFKGPVQVVPAEKKIGVDVVAEYCSLIPFVSESRITAGSSSDEPDDIMDKTITTARVELFWENATIFPV